MLQEDDRPLAVRIKEALPTEPTGPTGWARYNNECADFVGRLRAALGAMEQSERERYAKICEDIAERHLRSGRYVSAVADHAVRAGGQVDGAEECARAIREA